MLKVSIRKLDEYTFPLSQPVTSGGRIMHPAGEITQIVNGETFKFLSYIEFNDMAPVQHGGHYHEKKDEFLYVLKGKLRAVYRDLDTDQSITSTLQTGDLVHIKPRCAHVYFPLEHSQAIEFSPSVFEETDIHEYMFDIEHTF